jgi:hypothetical protein
MHVRKLHLAVVTAVFFSARTLMVSAAVCAAAAAVAPAAVSEY